MKYPRNVLESGIRIVKESDPALLEWLEAASKPVTKIVTEEVNGRVRRVHKTQQPHIVIGTGLRAQHMPARSMTTTEPLPKEWYDDKNEYNREFDPFGVYTQSGIKVITEFYERQFVQLGATAFIGGGATMADQLMMRAALKLGLRTMLKIPIPTQHANWDKHVQGVYFRQLAQVHLAVLVTDTDELMDASGFFNTSKVAYAMNKRNRAMLAVAPSTHVTVRRTVLATWRGANGGTKNCIEDAQRMKLDVVNVYDSLMVAIGFQKQVVHAQDNRITTEAFLAYNDMVKALDAPRSADLTRIVDAWSAAVGLPLGLRLKIITAAATLLSATAEQSAAFADAYARAHTTHIRPLQQTYYQNA